MREDELEVVRGSGNVFRDFDDPHADLKQGKAILAARILAVMDERKLTVRKAVAKTGFAAADFPGCATQTWDASRWTGCSRCLPPWTGTSRSRSMSLHGGPDRDPHQPRPDSASFSRRIFCQNLSRQ